MSNHTEVCDLMASHGDLESRIASLTVEVEHSRENAEKLARALTETVAAGTEMKARAETAEAQVKRLKAALVKIRDGSANIEDYVTCPCHVSIDEYIARAALQSTGVES